MPGNATSAHPRSRGEHTRGQGSGIDAGGSSPLARGTQVPTERRISDERLIPARAGNTLSRSSAPPSQPAHPRSHGEHGSLAYAWKCHFGSSPLARGTHARARLRHRRRRLIPARAGNTRYSAHRLLAHTAHPRSRGEHCRHIQDQPGRCGSSPLARGTLPHERRVGAVRRLIPARAGNTY